MAKKVQTTAHDINPDPIIVKPVPNVDKTGPFGGRAIDKGNDGCR